MVDFDGLKDKAQDFVEEHADDIKQGVGKAGDFVAGKIGHQEQVQKVEDAVTGLVDRLAGGQQQPADQPADQQPSGQQPADQ